MAWIIARQSGLRRCLMILCSFVCPLRVCALSVDGVFRRFLRTSPVPSRLPFFVDGGTCLVQPLWLLESVSSVLLACLPSTDFALAETAFYKEIWKGNSLSRTRASRVLLGEDSPDQLDAPTPAMTAASFPGDSAARLFGSTNSHKEHAPASSHVK